MNAVSGMQETPLQMAVNPECKSPQEIGDSLVLFKTLVECGAFPKEGIDKFIEWFLRKIPHFSGVGFEDYMWPSDNESISQMISDIDHTIAKIKAAEALKPQLIQVLKQQKQFDNQLQKRPKKSSQTSSEEKQIELQDIKVRHSR